MNASSNKEPKMKFNKKIEKVDLFGRKKKIKINRTDKNKTKNNNIQILQDN